MKESKRVKDLYENLKVDGKDPWDLTLELDWKELGTLRIESFKTADIWALEYWWMNTLSYENRRFHPLFPADARIGRFIANHYKNHERKRNIVFNAWLVREDHLEFDNEIIGHFYLIDWDSEKPSIGLGVSDTYQNRKLGTLFVIICILIMKSLGKKELWLTTDFDNERGYHVYAKLGFEDAGQTDVYLPGDGCYRKEREMKLDLSRDN